MCVCVCVCVCACVVCPCVIECACDVMCVRDREGSCGRLYQHATNIVVSGVVCKKLCLSVTDKTSYL